MANHLYHAPADCPVCGDDLIITRKGCLRCGTELAGEFASCAYCALDESDLDILKVFLTSRGNLREVEKHLQVSYPTARARLDAVVAKLGFGSSEGGQDAEREADSTAEPAGGTEARRASGEEGSPGPTAQEQILARVAAGEISSEVAATLIAAL